MTAQANIKERLFNAAAELTDQAQRAAFLDAACGGDPSLRAEIEDLLRHDDAAGGFVSAPALAPDATSGADPTEPPPREPLVARIGPYKLLEPIGEGGMGTVYMAEQTAPVHRMVALKVIKPGMDSRQVLARFEAERQALALMDHPNIAKVLDAGTTEQGRPYFVMELVKGAPITRCCDEKRMSLRERLELLLRDFLKTAFCRWYSLDSFHRDVCNYGPVDFLWPRWSEPPCPQSRNGLPAPLSSFAADTATSPRWRTNESNHGNRFTARPVWSSMP